MQVGCYGPLCRRPHVLRDRTGKGSRATLERCDILKSQSTFSAFFEVTPRSQAIGLRHSGRLRKGKPRGVFCAQDKARHGSIFHRSRRASVWWRRLVDGALNMRPSVVARPDDTARRKKKGTYKASERKNEETTQRRNTKLTKDEVNPDISVHLSSRIRFAVRDA